jgi:hypothetical protein
MQKIMKKNKIMTALLLISLLSVLPVNAAKIGFQSGEITAVFLTKNYQQFGKLAQPKNKLESSELYFPYNSAKPLREIKPESKYAVVIFFKPFLGRKLTVYDFSLSFNNKLFNCVSIADAKDSFKVYDPMNKNTGKWELSGNPKSNFYKMLFFIEGNNEKFVDKNKFYNLSLICNYIDTKPRLTIKARFIKDDKLPAFDNKIKYGIYPLVPSLEENMKPEVLTPAILPKYSAVWRPYEKSKHVISLQKSSSGKSWGWKVYNGKVYAICPTKLPNGKNIIKLKEIVVLSNRLILIDNAYYVKPLKRN